MRHPLEGGREADLGQCWRYQHPPVRGSSGKNGREILGPKQSADLAGPGLKAWTRSIQRHREADWIVRQFSLASAIGGSDVMPAVKSCSWNHHGIIASREVSTIMRLLYREEVAGIEDARIMLSSELHETHFPWGLCVWRLCLWWRQTNQQILGCHWTWWCTLSSSIKNAANHNAIQGQTKGTKRYWIQDTWRGQIKKDTGEIP